MSSSKNQNQISLTLFVDKKKVKVQYAEAGKDFVDILLSFLTLPLGTVSILLSAESTLQKSCRFNCLSSLRQSVEKLDPKYFNRANRDYKHMLLNPESPMKDYYRSIGYSCDDTPFSNGFRGYVVETTCYIVSDDLRVMPSNTHTTFWMLRSFGVGSVIERLTISVTQKEVVDLLKFSLYSKTTLTDLFLRKKLQIQNSGTQVLPKVKIKEVQGKVGLRMNLKLVISKSDRKVLFAEAENDFIDQLLSFLTIPVAAIESLEQGNSGLGCIDNLYQSSNDLDAAEFLNLSVHDLKDKLLNPRIATNRVKNQLLAVYNVSGSTPVNTIGYVRWGTKFMVRDDLCVEPFSSPSALSFLIESKVAESDLEQMDLSIGVDEVFGILKAAMLSTSALTNGLRPLLTVVKQDK